METTIPIIDNKIAEQIRTRIPHLYKEAIKWKLLYSIDQHGLSLNTLYSNIKHAGPCVMAITTENDEVFGAFTSEPFDPDISKSYYGSGLRLVVKKIIINKIKYIKIKIKKILIVFFYYIYFFYTVLFGSLMSKVMLISIKQNLQINIIYLQIVILLPWVEGKHHKYL